MLLFAIAAAVQLKDVPAEFNTEKETFQDVHKVQTDLKALQDNLKIRLAKFDQRMKTGNFPAPPAGMEMSLLQTQDEPVNNFAGLDKVQARLQALQQKIQQQAHAFDAEAGS